jgi:hypothetical protein
LFAIALISLPTYMSGNSAQKSVRGVPDVSQDVIVLHHRSALFALIFRSYRLPAGSRLVSHLNMGARVDSIVELEERPYGPESTHEEREAIADRASVVDDRILLIHEIAVQSPFSVKVMFDRFQALAHDWDRFAYVVDLTEAKRPDPETRAALKAQILGISPRVTHLAVAVGDNQLMRAMARLFAYGMGLTNVSIHATRAEAIEEARRAMGR